MPLGLTPTLAARVPPKAVELLQKLQLGGCTCMTKSPAIQYHDESCRYRLAVELEDVLATGPLETWHVGDRVIGGIHRDNPARITKLLEGEGFEFELETPHVLGHRQGVVFTGKQYTRDGWKRLPPAPAPVQEPTPERIEQAINAAARWGKTLGKDERVEWLSRAEVKRLLKAWGVPPTADDTARLDWLDAMNQRLNAQNGTTYRWELVLNSNVVRMKLDLNDTNRNGAISCRQAIDAMRTTGHN